MVHKHKDNVFKKLRVIRPIWLLVLLIGVDEDLVKTIFGKLYQIVAHDVMENYSNWIMVRDVMYFISNNAMVNIQIVFSQCVTVEAVYEI